MSTPQTTPDNLRTRPTPETDAVFLPIYCPPWRIGLKNLVKILFFARRLERQRNEAREELDELKETHLRMCATLRECVQKHNLGLGGENLDTLVVQRIEAMREAIKEAHAAFKRTEFIEDVNGLYCCPGCLNYEQNGHKPNCDYVAALAKLQSFIQ